MKASEIIKLDCTIAGNLDKLKAALIHIKPFEGHDPDDITVEKLEKVQRRIDKLSGYHIGYFMQTKYNDDRPNYWHATILEHVHQESKCVDTVFGLSLFEVFAKATIAMWILMKKKGQ